MPKPVTNDPGASWYEMKAAADSAVLDISIYDEIGYWGVSASDFKRTLDHYSGVETIRLSIHSPGGNVFDGMAIYNQLKNHPATVEVFVDGLAASMASLIAMAGDVVTMPENAFLMIHKPWVSLAGDAEELRESAELLDKIESTFIAAYRSKTGLPDEELSAMLTAETWLTGAEAVSLGFADQMAAPIQAAASLQSNLLRGFVNMPDKAKKVIGDPVVTDPATPAAAAPAATVTPAVAEPVAPVVDFKASERTRRDEINAVFAPFAGQADALQADCLDNLDMSAEQAKDKLLATLGAKVEPVAAASVHVGNGNIVRDSIANSIESRVGIATAESSNGFAGMTLIELARASLVESGVGIAGMGRMDIAGMAFTHSSGDFGSILSDVANKSMLRGYEETEETFQQWTSKGTLSDFKPSTRVDLSTFPSLRQVNESAEYKYATIGGTAESIVLATYGELLSISRQAIINDDLSAFDRLPRMMGRAAIRTVGNLVYAILTANAKMASDNKALFHTDHKNQITGGLSVANIDAAKVKMGTQKDGESSLNIRPAYLLTSLAQESAAKAFLGAEFDPAYTDKNVPNPIRNIVDVIADARLDDSSATTSYMTASPNQYDTIEVAYLDGNETPFLEQQGGFTVDGAIFKVRMDAGVAPLSFRTMAKISA